MAECGPQIDRLQRELVERRKLLTSDDQKSLMLAAAMIPAPKFLAFAAMVGYRIGGDVGGSWILGFILLPGTLIVIAACVLTIAASENPALAIVQRYVGLGVIGLLAGNAVRMFVGEGIERGFNSVWLSDLFGNPSLRGPKRWVVHNRCLRGSCAWFFNDSE